MTHRRAYVTKTDICILNVFFTENNDNADFIRRNIYRPTEGDTTNWNPTPVTTVTIPYIKGTSGTLSRILQPYNIRVPTNLQLRYVTCSPTRKTGTSPTTDREQFTRSNAPTARLPTLVRLAETSTQE